MKKILEVLQYGEGDIRFETDIDVRRDKDIGTVLMCKILMAMESDYWQQISDYVFDMIYALTVADLACSVNREEMLEILRKDSENVIKIKEEANMMYRDKMRQAASDAGSKNS